MSSTSAGGRVRLARDRPRIHGADESVDRAEPARLTTAEALSLHAVNTAGSH